MTNTADLLPDDDLPAATPTDGSEADNDTDTFGVDLDAQEVEEAAEAEAAEENGDDPGDNAGGADAAATQTGDADGQQSEKGDSDADAATSAAEREAQANAQGDGQKTADPEAGQQPLMIPKKRFDEVAQQRDRAMLEAAYHKGRADEAAIATTASQGDDGAAEPTPEEQITELRAERLALARRVDEGEINTVEWEQQRAALDDREHAIRQAQILTSVPKSETADSGQGAPAKQGDDLYLEQLTIELESRHPRNIF